MILVPTPLTCGYKNTRTVIHDIRLQYLFSTNYRFYPQIPTGTNFVDSSASSFKTLKFIKSKLIEKCSKRLKSTTCFFFLKLASCLHSKKYILPLINKSLLALLHVCHCWIQLENLPYVSLTLKIEYSGWSTINFFNYKSIRFRFTFLRQQNSS